MAKKESKVIKKTQFRKEFILDNYTNALTPLPQKLIAKKLGITEKALELFIYRHNLKRQDSERLDYATQLIKEKNLSDEQIKNITKISLKKIQEIRRNNV